MTVFIEVSQAKTACLRPRCYTITVNDFQSHKNKTDTNIYGVFPSTDWLSHTRPRKTASVIEQWFKHIKRY